MDDNTIKTNDFEIDLLEFIQKIGVVIKKTFLALVKSILFMLSFALKKIYFLILFALAGAAIGFMAFTATPSYYSSNIIIQTNGIASSDMVDYLNDLHNQCLNSDYSAIASDLQISINIATGIKDIQAYNIVDVNNDNIGDFIDIENSFDPRDTMHHLITDRLHLSIEIFDSISFEEVKKGLAFYMRKNPHVLNQNVLRKKEIKELIELIDREIITLDKLQEIELFGAPVKASHQSDHLVLYNGIEKPLYYQNKLSLKIKQQQYQTELELLTDVFTIIKDFTSPLLIKKTMSSYLMKYGVLVVLIGFVLLLLFYYRKKINKL